MGSLGLWDVRIRNQRAEPSTGRLPGCKVKACRDARNLSVEAEAARIREREIKDHLQINSEVYN